MATWPIEKSGDKGENIRTVQYLLNAHRASLSVDADFGPATQAAVKAFQKKHGLTQDGIVGNQTWPALIITVKSGSSGDAVTAVQSQVDSRLPKRLAIDGDFGPKRTTPSKGFRIRSGPLSTGSSGRRPGICSPTATSTRPTARKRPRTSTPRGWTRT